MGTFVESLKKFENEINVEKQGPTITISGSSGSGKSTVAEAIAKALRLKIVNAGDLFRQLAKEQGLSIEKFSETRKEDIDIMLDKKTIELAAKGGVVIIGRIAAWVAGDFADVKILVDAEMHVKAKRVAKRENKTIRGAKKDLVERDKADNLRYKELYNIDTNDKSVYDYVFDNTKATFKQATTIPVAKVKELLKNKQK